MPKTEIELMACDGFFHCVVVAIELVADGGSDEIGAVRVEALLNQEVHLTEVHVTEVDGDLFAIAHLGSKLAHTAHFNHPTTIRLDGIWPCSSCCKCLLRLLLFASGFLRHLQDPFSAHGFRPVSGCAQRLHRCSYGS